MVVIPHRLCVMLILVVTTAFGQHPPSGRDQGDNSPSALDRQLLDSLQSELLEGLDNLPLKGTVNEESKTGEPRTTNPLDQLEGGEDIEFGQRANPQTRIGQKMRAVERLIHEQSTSSKTQQLQREIVRDLSQLIDQQQPSSSSQGNPSNSQQAGSQNQNSSNGSDPIGDVSQPQQSTSRLGNSDPLDAQLDRREEVLSEAWGQLPERFLQRLQSAGIDEFLPKYEELIEQYYKRLAEKDQIPP